MNTLRTIMVALDFSPSSGDALTQAQRLASWTSATVRAVHAVYIPVFAPMGPTAMPYELPSAGVAVQDAQSIAKSFAQARRGGAMPEVEYIVGQPADGVLEAARKHNADLLVMGTNSVDEPHPGVGTVAAACVRGAACPVLLVRRAKVGAFRTVTACVDFSETSRIAVEQAIRVAARDSADLHILHVYEEPWSGMSTPAPIKDNMPDFQAKFRQAVIDRLKAFCEPMAHELGALKAHFQAVPHVRGWGGQGRGVAQFVKTHGVDLVVLGTRSNWNVRDFVLGSTAERVVRDANCSILAVKPKGMGKG